MGVGIVKIIILILAFLVAAHPVLAEDAKEVELLRQGSGYLEAQDYQKAAQAFKEAARLNPASAEAQTGLGMAYLKIGHSEAATNVEVVENAAAALKEAVRIAPRSAEAQYHLGVASLLLYDKSGAMKAYEALRDLDDQMAERLFSRIAAYKQPKSFGKVVTQVGAAQSDTTRVTVAGNHVLVPATLTQGDRSVQATLILDTGASSTMITSDVAKRLNMKLQDAGVAKFQVADGRIIQAWHMKLDRVSVGPKSKNGLDVVIIESGSSFPFEGLLGMDFLRSFKHSIDFGNQVINWAP